MPRADAVLLDTHVLLWWQARSDRMSKRALEHITAAEVVLISPITCWELAMLVGKQRVALDRPTAVWVRDLLVGDVRLADLTARAAISAAELGDFHGDPADRIIYATARTLGCPLVSQDQRLRRYASKDRGATVIW